MTPSFEIIRQQAHSLPLTEQLSLAAELIETARQALPQTLSVEPVPDRVALLKEVSGSMRGKLSSVDEFMREEQAEREREEEREARRQRERSAA